ncbi:MFS transporter [Bacillus canaveralius]|uniref:MFS transporter n=1 Tax=Bacillus canaveralius TaxID=1403243 RepID=UPI000F78E88F|nr:MFS transporter [Bacillus canaveralius]RSK52656.1 MFS transporter [Bacillus canaveralius]
MVGNQSVFRAYLVGRASSTFASTFGTFLISWILYDLTGSKTAMGSLFLLSILAQIAVQFIVGPYIDRWSRTLVMKLSEIIRIVTFIMLLICLSLASMDPIILYIAAFLTSIVIYDAAADAIIPKLVHQNELVKANAKISGLTQLIRLIALPVGGFLVANFGQIIAVAIVLSFYLFSIMLLPLLKEKNKSPLSKASWMGQFKAGLDIYTQHKILLILGMFIATTSFGVFATQAMYIPYVTDILGGTSFEYGFFAASFPLGYILGSYLVGKLKAPGKYLYLVMISALFVGGSTHIFLGLTESFWLALLFEMVAGIVMPFWNVYSTTIYQRLVPDEILGQVFSVRFLLSKAATPIGILYGTFCATVFSLPFLFLSVGIILCAVTGMGFFLIYRASKANYKTVLSVKQ